MMPLSMSGAGEAQIIKKIGGKEEVRSFLEKLGFVVGTEVTVQLRTSEHRSMYSYVRLSIDRCTATYV